MKKQSIATAIAPVTNGGEPAIQFSEPYTISVTIEGVAALLYHRWNTESVEEKAVAPKGSRAKKTDDIESYVMRDEKGRLLIPGDWMRGAIVHAARYLQDPRSPRKSAMDLYKAGVVVTTEGAPVGKDTWDYLDQRRFVVQRNAVTRVRPALLKGWKATFEIMVVLPEYIPRQVLIQVIANAGRFCGLGDYRPTYGRFIIIDATD